MNEKISRNLALLHKSHQRNKHLSGPASKMLRTFLKMEKGKTQANGPEDKKVDDDAQDLTFER